MGAAARRGLRVVLAAYLVVVVAFIAWTTLIVVRQIFVDARVPSRGEVLPPLPYACEAGLRELGDALDRGLQAAIWADDEETAARRFAEAIEPSWRKQSSIAESCSGDQAATAAYAAIVRERRVQEGWARRHARETVLAAGGARRFLPLGPGVSR
jgi:hypothetical protein